jgi:hypothetical protein
MTIIIRKIKNSTLMVRYLKEIILNNLGIILKST